MHAETVKLAMDCLAVLIENVNDQESLSKDEEITNIIILSLFNLLRSPSLVNVLDKNNHNLHTNGSSLNGTGRDGTNLRVNSITGNLESESPNNNLRASIFRLIALLSDKNYIYANKIIKRALSYIISTNWEKDQKVPESEENQNNLKRLADFLAVIGTSCLVSDIDSDKDSTKLKTKCLEIISEFDNETVWLRALEILAIIQFEPEHEMGLFKNNKFAQKLQNRIQTRFNLLEDHPPILDIDFTPKLPKRAILQNLNLRLQQSGSNTSISSSKTLTEDDHHHQDHYISNSSSRTSQQTSDSYGSTTHSSGGNSNGAPKRWVHSAGKSRGNNQRLPWTKPSGASSKTSNESLITHHPMNMPKTPPKVGSNGKLELVADGLGLNGISGNSNNSTPRRKGQDIDILKTSPIPNKASLVRTSSARQSQNLGNSQNSANSNTTSGYSSMLSSAKGSGSNSSSSKTPNTYSNLHNRKTNNTTVSSIFNEGLVDTITDKNTKYNGQNQSFSPNLYDKDIRDIDSDVGTLHGERRSTLVSRESGLSLASNTTSQQFEDLFSDGHNSPTKGFYGGPNNNNSICGGWYSLF